MSRRSRNYTVPLAAMLALATASLVLTFRWAAQAWLWPLPYRDSARLVVAYPADPAPSGNRLAWYSRSHAFSDLALYSTRHGDAEVAVTVGGALRLAQVAWVSRNFFGVFGIPAAKGSVVSGLRAGEAVVSAGLWGYRGDRLLGQTITVGGALYRVAAVMPAQFDFPPSTGIWLVRDDYGAQLVGRLRPGVTSADAAMALTERLRRIAQMEPAVVFPPRLRVWPIRQRLLGPERGSFTLLVLCGGALLLLAAVNFAGLQNAWLQSRKNEIGIRLALGARPTHLALDLGREVFPAAMIGMGTG